MAYPISVSQIDPNAHSGDSDRAPDRAWRSCRQVIHLLGLSGSLRAASTNRALLRAAAASAPRGVELTLYDHLADLPIFNPDLEEGLLPEPVAGLRHAVMAADGLLFAVPEYAHGIPGGLKNALDWLVSGSEMPGKPVAFFHASPRSHASRAALEAVLRTMSTAIVPEAAATVPLLGLAPEAVARRLAEPEIIMSISEALGRFAEVIRAHRSQFLEKASMSSPQSSSSDDRA